jgi:hypothetical protein
MTTKDFFRILLNYWSSKIILHKKEGSLPCDFSLEPS